MSSDTFSAFTKNSNSNNSRGLNFLTAISKTCKPPLKIDHPYPIWSGRGLPLALVMQINCAH